METIEKLKARAALLRKDSIRATTQAGSGHPTSCMSLADIIAVLFFDSMRQDISHPFSPKNDRCILSKGHAIPVIYAAYKQLGAISDEQLLTLRHHTSDLEGHPTPRFVYNEVATGSLGQGLAAGIGYALAARHEQSDAKTYVILGDSECSEGSVWEAATLASYYKLSSLIAIVDINGLGQTGRTKEQHDISLYHKRWEGHGWHVLSCQGHDIEEIKKTLESVATKNDAPTVILASTSKGYGWELVQDNESFHGKVFSSHEAEKASFYFDSVIVKSGYSEKELVASLVPLPAPRTLAALSLSFTYAPSLSSQEQNMSPRQAFGKALMEAGRMSEKIVVLDAEVSNSTFTSLFEKQFPDRFIQTFIAEPSMVSVATGLERRGYIPFLSTFAAFFTRAHDQLRMAAIDRAALRVCGTHVGVSIGQDGPSQMGLEDIALFRSLPESIVLYPSDAYATVKLVIEMASYTKGISYVRATRGELPCLYGPEEQFPIGGCKILRSSAQDVCLIIAAGITLHEALKAYSLLQREGIHVSIIDLYSIKPLPAKEIAVCARAAGGRALIVEDHYAQGGMGEAVTAALSLYSGIEIHRQAVEVLPRSGDGKELLHLMGLDAQSISDQVKHLCL